MPTGSSCRSERPGEENPILPHTLSSGASREETPAKLTRRLLPITVDMSAETKVEVNKRIFSGLCSAQNARVRPKPWVAPAASCGQENRIPRRPNARTTFRRGG